MLTLQGRTMDGVRHRLFELTLAASSPEGARTGVLVVGVYADGSLPPASRRVDTAANGGLAAILQLGDLGGHAGETLLLHHLNGIAAERVLLVSLGARDRYGDNAFRDAFDGAARALAAGAAKDAAVTLADVDVPGRTRLWRLQQASRLLADGAYHFTVPRPMHAGGHDHARGAGRVRLLMAGPVNREDLDAVRQGLAIAEGMALAKDLGNLPGNVCTPAFLAEAAGALGREFGFEVEVLERDDMQELGMGAALAVAQASEQPAKFIVMRYGARERSAGPVVLIGATFDTGGRSRKAGTNTDERKFDRCGAASVFGAMNVVARLRLPVGVVGIVPAFEHIPGGRVSRPGDVVTSMSGQTIEILDRGTEGCLALADALTYAERFDPACVIDIATLTEACVVALGHVASGLFANDDELAAHLMQSAIDSGDRVWRLPMFEEYQGELKSAIADLSNLGGHSAGTITAACFLGRFARTYKWAHLDIAGTKAVADGKGATGRPVPLLSEFLLSRASQSSLHPALGAVRNRRSNTSGGARVK
jgi:leucyl aminopeptidase